MIQTINGRRHGFATCDVRRFPVVALDPDLQHDDPDEATGYVTACSLQCAADHAEHIDHRLAPDAEARAEAEDDRGSCDACGYPDPVYGPKDEEDDRAE